MAGPTCSVLSSTLHVAKDIVDELVRLCGDSDGPNGFLVRDTRSIGGLYDGEGRPFIWFTDPREPDECSSIKSALGFIPTQDIGLGAMRDQRVDHQILGEMALWLAERTAGFVDLGGTLPIPPEIPGRTARIPYDTASGWRSEYLILDQVAFRAWLSCPVFAMVK
jgi:hypothetical protein